jgi:hypothetical protein
MKQVVTFATERPAPRAGELVVLPERLRTIAEFADVEAMLKEGIIDSVVILGEPTIGLAAWALAVQRNAERG